MAILCFAAPEVDFNSVSTFVIFSDLLFHHVPLDLSYRLFISIYFLRLSSLLFAEFFMLPEANLEQFLKSFLLRIVTNPTWTG